MTTSRGRIEAIYRASVDAVDPRATVRQAIENLSRSSAVDLSASGVHIVAIGKAAAQMAAGATDALGDRIKRGIVVTKEPVAAPLPGMTCLQGSHPVPDERSLRAGEAVLDFARGVPVNACVICLISGGGSALVEALRPGLGLDDLQAVTRSLLAAGAPIEEINIVRSRLSRIKGGGLLRALEHCRVINLIVSDVLGDNLQAIASGPSVVPELTATAEEIVERYSLAITLPPAASMLEHVAPVTRVVANLSVALDAAAAMAEELGLRPVWLSGRLEGEAREVGRTLAAILGAHSGRHSPLKPGDCALAGGETTVTVRGDGVGGRNTEAALAAAIDLRGVRGVTVGFLATDGDDGVTSAAGAIVDGATISAETAGPARRALERNDSFGFLARTGAIWAPGPTGANVNDLVIAIIE